MSAILAVIVLIIVRIVIPFGLILLVGSLLNHRRHTMA